MRSIDAAVRWRNAVTGSVVFTNGVFDLLHAGHVALLERARGFGEALIVGVNSDRSARLLAKGADRPFVATADRAMVLAALSGVDCVVVFDEPTPALLIEALRPDVLVKGADYRIDQVVGADAVLARGGRVELVSLLDGRSTTRLVEKIRASS